MLRLGVIGVALFAFVYGAFLYSPKQPILIYMEITGALFLSWSGAVIIGGLYWERGTRLAAWLSALFGSGIVLVTFFVQEMNKQVLENGFVVMAWGLFDSRGHPALDGTLRVLAHSTPDGKQIFGMTIALCTLVYYVVSRFSRSSFDMDRMLRRGEYELEGEVERVGESPRGLLGRLMSFTSEHTRGDKAIYVVTFATILFWVLIVVVGSLMMAAHLGRGGTVEETDGYWLAFWRWRVWFLIATGVGATIWLTIGGVYDFRRLLRDLASAERDDRDDGIVKHIDEGD
jgi:SSS family solute:Na+ symporter